jgi:DNA-binding XRE family transcriptional regulator
MSIETAVSPNPQWDFGDRLRKVRRSIAGMSQREMAETLGITQKAYAAWESGLNRPKDIVAVAKQIESAWPGRVMSAWLLGVDNDGPRPPTPPPTNMPWRDEHRVRLLRPVAEADPEPDIKPDDVVSDEALGWLQLGEPAKPALPTDQSVDQPIDLLSAA